jgi:catechol 2,3-dioxygenase-like lactoylglutathione lyase family enzyme
MGEADRPGRRRVENGLMEDRMILGVRDVYYLVTDMKKAITFYRDVLGLRLVEESVGWSAFDVGGVRLGLHERDPGTPYGAVVTFEVGSP